MFPIGELTGASTIPAHEGFEYRPVWRSASARCECGAAIAGGPAAVRRFLEEHEYDAKSLALPDDVLFGPDMPPDLWERLEGEG